MAEISAKSVSDVHGIIQNYEIENNSKFRVVQNSDAHACIVEPHQNSELQNLLEDPCYSTI
jgi:hypothetical protein